MKCPKCEQEGRRSEVVGCGATQTMMYYQPFYDEDGRRHDHDANVVEEHFRCSNEHFIKRTTRGRCWCGWTGGEEEIEARDI
jgi:hypothetical protein